MDPSAERDGAVVSALFSSGDDAERAMADLRSAGFTRVELSEGGSATASPRRAASGDATVGGAFFNPHESTASSFRAELDALAFDGKDARDLVAAIVAGGAIVTAETGPDARTAVAILRQHAGDVRFAAGTTVAGAPAANAAGDRAMTLREERLNIDKELVQRGEARVHKELVTRMESIEVPVSHEELVIEQVAFSADGTEAAIGAGAPVRIPLTQEELTITKTTHVVADVTVGTRLVQETQHVSATTREERLRIDDDTPSGGLSNNT